MTTNVMDIQGFSEFDYYNDFCGYRNLSRRGDVSFGEGMHEVDDN